MTAVGELVRSWRQRRRLSQLDLAVAADVSSRHLSFIETGRSKPSSQMLIHLSEHLDIPLRERNALLLAGGFAPAYPEHGLDAPPMAAVNEAIERVLAAHQPYPAVVVDRHWEMVAANPAIGVLIEGCATHLLEPPVNVLRLSLHPDGMAPRIANLGAWRAHLLARLRRDVDSTGDAVLAELLTELGSYPGGAAPEPPPTLVVPLIYRRGDTELAFFSTTTVFGTPLDVTVSELAIEAFYPEDETTAAALRALPVR
ncbi:MAG: helix-turn-helix transcriptional regulator [Pseudonocardia sp.]|uniref:helix-turn-helix domain-containing protein n=1 Tax=Pseudonocardia sp. TaxID=60912 RepID=UPI001AC8E9BF|nr:helix-turn-helix transcriptional regulator [Pseudonocardia sp.]MBN9099126.1 helix-turn-helix transcriptional regulator [Pseudonocardia sp.]